MKITRVLHNADIYTNEPVLLKKIATPTRPPAIINNMRVWVDNNHYVVLCSDKDGYFLNRLDAMRFILLVCRMSGANACLVERCIKVANFTEFNLLDFQ